MPDHWQPNSINAGIIPRAVHHIFNELAHNSTLQGTNEYSVRVSHLEVNHECDDIKRFANDFSLHKCIMNAHAHRIRMQLYGEKLIDLLSSVDAKEPNLVDDGKTVRPTKAIEIVVFTLMWFVFVVIF